MVLYGPFFNKLCPAGYPWGVMILLFLIKDDLVEKKQKEVTIHDLDPLALTLLVDFSYTGEIVICEDNVQVSHKNMWKEKAAV